MAMKKMKINRKIKFLIIGIASVAAVVVILICVRKLVSSKNASNLTYMVKTETLQNVISVSGVVSAAQEQTLQALSDGTVTNVYVKQGDEVKKGKVLIQLDDTTQQYNLAKHDYDMETVKINGSRRELALKQTERKSLVQKIAERKVIATFDGIIADIDVAVGDSLEAKDSVGTIVDISYLTADVEVAETDVSKLKIGQQVELKFPSYDGIVMGKVIGWPAIGEVTSRGATVVKVKIQIDEYPASILPNFSFSGKIKISPDEDILLVERYAVGRENKKAFVVKATGEKIDVEVVPYSSEYVKIVSGDVKEGDVLLQQTTPKVSGTRRNMGPKNGMPGVMPGAPAMGGRK